MSCAYGFKKEANFALLSTSSGTYYFSELQTRASKRKTRERGNAQQGRNLVTLRLELGRNELKPPAVSQELKKVRGAHAR